MALVLRRREKSKGRIKRRYKYLRKLVSAPTPVPFSPLRHVRKAADVRVGHAQLGGSKDKQTTYAFARVSVPPLDQSSLGWPSPSRFHFVSVVHIVGNLTIDHTHGNWPCHALDEYVHTGRVETEGGWIERDLAVLDVNTTTTTTTITPSALRWPPRFHQLAPSPPHARNTNPTLKNAGAPVVKIPGRAHPVTPFFLEDVLERTGYMVDPKGDFAVKGSKGGGGGGGRGGGGGGGSGGGMKPGDWECPACGNNCFASKGVCNR